MSMTVLIGTVVVFALFMANLALGMCEASKIDDEQLQEAIHTEIEGNN